MVVDDGEDDVRSGPGGDGKEVDHSEELNAWGIEWEIGEDLEEEKRTDRGLTERRLRKKRDSLPLATIFPIPIIPVEPPKLIIPIPFIPYPPPIPRGPIGFKPPFKAPE